MADELDALAERLHHFIEQERFEEAQGLLPEYTRALDTRLRNGDGSDALKRSIGVFHGALSKAKVFRSHIAAQLSDVNRAQAYTGPVNRSGGWNLIG